MAEEFAGYRVNVYSKGDTLAKDAKGFSFGEWQEIGYWLDECGYNNESHTVTILFVEERD